MNSLFLGAVSKQVILVRFIPQWRIFHSRWISMCTSSSNRRIPHCKGMGKACVSRILCWISGHRYSKYCAAAALLSLWNMLQTYSWPRRSSHGRTTRAYMYWGDHYMLTPGSCWIWCTWRVRVLVGFSLGLLNRSCLKSKLLASHFHIIGPVWKWEKNAKTHFAKFFWLKDQAWSTRSSTVLMVH